MKKYSLFTLLALAILSFSCQKPEAAFLEALSSTSESVLTEGGIVNIKFKTNVAWMADRSRFPYLQT